MFVAQFFYNPAICTPVYTSVSNLLYYLLCSYYLLYFLGYFMLTMATENV